MTCGTCRYSDTVVYDQPSEPGLICRLHPPRPLEHDGFTAWPAVDTNDWCGQWVHEDDD